MKKIIGNLIDLAFDGQFDVIAHGCNCFKHFGAGIALEIKNRIPEAYQADLQCEKSILGEYTITYVDRYKRNKNGNYTMIVNCYTQHYFGKPYSEMNKTKYEFDTAEARYDAIRKCFKAINERFRGQSIGLPLIGCGLAGLEWSIVEKIIEEELNQMDVTIVIFNEKERIKNNIILTY